MRGKGKLFLHFMLVKSRCPVLDGSLKRSVSVILPTRNVESNIGRLLHDILNQDYAGKIDVLVMDSSDDRTAEIARSYGQRAVRVEPEDYNYGATRNLGVRLTDGEICVFLSADIRIANNRWLANMVRNFDDERVAGVYSRQVPWPDASPMEQFSRFYFYPPERRVFEYNPGVGLGMEQLFFSNVSSAIRRDVYERFPLPEMLKTEEWVWARTVLKAGYRIVYEPESVVYHSHNYTLRQVFREYFDSGASFTAVFPGTRFSPVSLLKSGTQYILRELQFLSQIGKFWTTPYALLYEGMKGLGLLLGLGYKHMPRRLTRLLCKKRNHWDKYDDVIAPPTSFWRARH